MAQESKDKSISEMLDKATVYGSALKHAIEKADKKDIPRVKSKSEDNFFDDVTKKFRLQRLEERKILLDTLLEKFFKKQLMYMNFVIGVLVLWFIVDGFTVKYLSIEMIKIILSFLKYYISAILVELLAAIVYIVYQVFSTKI